MDELVKKLAAFGLPGAILVILAASSAGSNAAVVAALTALGGPFGILGGIGVLGLITMVGDIVGKYGIEAVLNTLYTERSKTESVRYLLKEIEDLPVSDELKLKLKNKLSLEVAANVPPKPIEIVEEI
jgi:hypothetical protein